MPDGTSAGENFGRAPGATVHTAGSDEAVELIRKVQSGKRPVFIQGRGVAGRGMLELSTTMNFSQGSMALIRGSPGALFVTSSGGETIRSMPMPTGVKPIDMDSEWEKLEAEMRTRPAGPSRLISFSLTSRPFTFKAIDGSAGGVTEIVGRTGDVSVAKNRVTKIALGTFVVRALPAFEYPAQMMKSDWAIHSVLSRLGRRTVLE